VAAKPPVVPVVRNAPKPVPFKAAPAPKQVLASRAGQIGIKLLPKRSETVAQDVHFASERRPKARAPAPAPARIAPKEEPVAPPPRVAQTPRGPTRAVSPRLSTRKRAETRMTMSAVKPAPTPSAAVASAFRARPMPDFGKSPAVGLASAGPKSASKRTIDNRSSIAPESAKKARVAKPVPFKDVAAEQAKERISQEIAREVAQFSHFVTQESGHGALLPLHDNNGKSNASNKAAKKPAVVAAAASVLASAVSSSISSNSSSVVPASEPLVAAFNFNPDAYDVEAGVPMSDYPTMVPGLRAL
jgi:hypothetical protein